MSQIENNGQIQDVKRQKDTHLNQKECDLNDCTISQ